MKIAVVGARGIPGVEGGAEKNAEMLFPLIAKEHDVTLFCLRTFTNGRSYRGVKIVSAPEIRLFGTDKLICYAMAAMRTLWEQPDIIHCQGLGSAIFLLLYKLAGRRVVVRYGSADYEMAKWGWIGRAGFLFSEWQLRFADAVIVVSPALQGRLVARGIRVRAEFIPNALDPPELDIGRETALLSEHGLEAGRFVLGIGRVTPQKDFLTLVRAFRAAREGKSCSAEKLVIAGGSDGSGCFETLQREAGSDVVLTGRLSRSDVQCLLRSCAAYVNCSVHEGMSNAILEAISVGAPTLMSDIPENRDLPVPPHHFFRTGDPSSLSCLIFEATQERERFVVDRSQFADWSQVAAKTIELYDSLFCRLAAPSIRTRVTPE